MFDISMEFMKDLVDLIVPVMAIYIVFDLCGSLLFGKK